jgi:Ni/Fe-hydrogenase subunit HybB-like protein
VQSAPASLRRTTVRVAAVVLGIVIVLSVAELTSDRFKAFTQDHSLFTTFMTEAVLLVGVYLVIDEIIERRDARRWWT